eukprot:TRINITY_DN51509_c0_g1_i1.p1 TRINITY_DN51509_c0_g1~~TRINITY_DN51509_c0_g1_i1.p1  ORF type:complete len:205 (-),score=38.26 TRINITY_DN51509_c0_g1_i1:31-645(-)
MELGEKESTIKILRYKEYNEFKKKHKDLLKQSDSKAKEEKKTEIGSTPQNCFLRATNLPKNTTKKNLLNLFSFYGTPAYIDYEKNNDTAVLRFLSESLCETFLETFKAKGQYQSLNKRSIELLPLTPAEQESYLLRIAEMKKKFLEYKTCLLYTSDAADDTPCVDLGGRRITKKKNLCQQLLNLRLGNIRPGFTSNLSRRTRCL